MSLATLDVGIPTTSGAENDLRKEVVLYRDKLAEYKRARIAYEQIAAPYWNSISDKRSKRSKKRARDEHVARGDYVLEQPPVYLGPPEPQNPETRSSSAEVVPVVADFLRYAKEQFDFVPEAPATETDYKRAYAEAALASGLKPEQCVKIYAFESGGNGTYDVQAGLEYDVPTAHAITTALGYNQLLSTNSVELLAEAGDQFISALRKRAEAATSEARQTALRRKIIVLRKMVAFSRTVPDQWREHARLAETPKGMAIHALNLDTDVGPLLQTQKLLTSVAFARKHGHGAPLTAAELEMMNLTGDGNGFDMVLMPDDLRGKVPTSNFFQRGGYERNPVASTNNTVAKLLAATDAKMETEAQLQGAKTLKALFEELQ